ncbi:MAG: YncE family protein [Bacillati bacterium ANGP1]|uniref:YncE family protein n=1 Tax=Candidatus Segetimicrobium genomatis TaxID=2569760 RepID=A0A537IIC2_9BACT|nr:MAG: YncE family protein [Terrabacteria group bacterium ANGP1]
MNKIRTLLWVILFLIATSAITAGAAPFAYVANLGGGVSVIDTASNTVAATVQAGIGPQGVAITPNGAFAYVANFTSNDVSVIDTATNTVVATVPVGAGPWGVAIAPSGAFAYVTAFDFCVGSVSVIDTTVGSPTVNTVVATVSPLGGCLTGVAVAPSGAFAYVANFTANNVAVIDTSTNTVLTTVPVGSGPRGLAITPNGAFAYVANSMSNTVSVLETTTNTVIATVASGTIVGGPFGVAVTPNGSFAYVTVFDTVSLSCIGGVWVIDTITNTVVATVSPLDSCPSGVAITPNGAFVYVTQSGLGTSANSVSVISTASNSVVATIGVGIAPGGVAITPAIVPLNVAIDVKPGGGPNNINTTSQSLIRVVILSSSDFDAFARVDPSSLTFGRTGDEPSLASCDASASDANGDGLPDLVCHFFKTLTAFQPGDTVGVLKGSTVDGQPIVGTDAVHIVR